MRLRCLSVTGGSWGLNAPLDTVRAGGRLSPVTDRWKTFLDYVVAKITCQLPPWLPPDRFMAAWATAAFRINHLVVEASGLAVLDEFEGPEVAFGDHGHVAALLDLVEGGGLCRTQGALEDRGQQQGGGNYSGPPGADSQQPAAVRRKRRADAPEHGRAPMKGRSCWLASSRWPLAGSQRSVVPATHRSAPSRRSVPETSAPVPSG